MKYIPGIDVMIYVCSPRVRRLRELEEHGLYLSDIPMHDATREIVMTSESQQVRTPSVRFSLLLYSSISKLCVCCAKC